MNTPDFILRLNQQYFDGELSSGFQHELAKLPLEREDVLEFIERMFVLMNKGGHPAHDLSCLQGNILGSLIARILPGGWEGKIPPITVAGRHKGVDEYFRASSLFNHGPKRMLDIGCGFPPYTTLETAAAFPDWQITGADPSLPVYLVYDEVGNYCTFDEHKAVVYFQPAIPSVENWNALLTDPRATRAKFKRLLDELLAEEKDYTEEDFPRLRIDPIHHHSNANLDFINAGIGDFNIDPVDVIRCFNVLFYFNDEFRLNSLEWFSDQLKEGGHLITGSDWALSTEIRYYLYQKKNGSLELKEFAFSIDNFSPVGIVTWYTNLDDDREVHQLAEYLSVLRKDTQFTRAFYELNDRLHRENGICPRDADGYYGNVDQSMSPTELWGRVSAMERALSSSGLVDKAVDVLKSSGYNARKNEVGHIAVEVE